MRRGSFFGPQAVGPSRSQGPLLRRRRGGRLRQFLRGLRIGFLLWDTWLTARRHAATHRLTAGNAAAASRAFAAARRPLTAVDRLAARNLFAAGDNATRAVVAATHFSATRRGYVGQQEPEAQEHHDGHNRFSHGKILLHTWLVGSDALPQRMNRFWIIVRTCCRESRVSFF